MNSLHSIARWKIEPGHKMWNTSASQYKWAAFEDGWATSTARGFDTKKEAAAFARAMNIILDKLKPSALV